MNWNNNENTWDERRPTLNRWWDRAENKNDAMPNTMSTSPVAQQAAKQWLERCTQSKIVIDDKRKTQPASIIVPREKCLDLCKCAEIMPIARQAASEDTVRTSAYGLADEVCRMRDRMASGPMADDRRLCCSLSALVRRVKRLIDDLDVPSDRRSDRLATLIEQYHRCRDEYRKLCARLR